MTRQGEPIKLAMFWGRFFSKDGGMIGGTELCKSIRVLRLLIYMITLPRELTIGQPLLVTHWQFMVQQVALTFSLLYWSYFTP